MPNPTPQKPQDDLDAAMAALEGNQEADVDLGALDADIDAIGEESPVESAGEGMDSEGAAKEELSETLKQFQRSREAERKLFENTTDSEYWFCVCFQTRDQKEEFLRQTGWIKDGDKYLDGVKLAKILKVTLPSGEVRFVQQETAKRLVNEVGTIENPTKPQR